MLTSSSVCKQFKLTLVSALCSFIFHAVVTLLLYDKDGMPANLFLGGR